MAEKPPLIHVPAIFPKKPYTIRTVLVLSVFAFFVAIAAWASFRELILPFLR